MEKFCAGVLETTVHGMVTYCVVGKNKSTAIDSGNDEIEITRENLRLDKEQYITRFRIKNISGTMMKLISAYPFVSDDFRVNGIPESEWMVFNGTRQINDVPSVCTLGVRDEAFSCAADRLSDEGIMLKTLTHGDAVLSGDGITVIKAGKTYISLEMLTQDNQLDDISLSLDCDGALKAVRAGGDFNCLLEPDDIKVTDWVRISVGGNYRRMIEDYVGHVAALHESESDKKPPCFVYTVTNGVSPENISDKVRMLSHLKIPVDYFVIGTGWQQCVGDLESHSEFSEGMRREAECISDGKMLPGITTAPFIADKKSQLYEENKKMFLRHADGSACVAQVNGTEYVVLDVSAPETLEWLEMLYQRLSACGYYFHSVEYTNVFMLQKDVVLANPTVSMTEAYVKAMTVIKSAVGSEGYLHVSNAFLEPLCGIVDSAQICSDSKWSGLVNRNDNLPRLMNQIVHRSYSGSWWNCSCGKFLDTNIFSTLNTAELRTVLVSEYICGGTTVISNLSSNDELKLLRFLYPKVKTSACCRTMFSGEMYVNVTDVDVNDDYHTLCFTNWSNEEVPIIFRLDNMACGGYVDHASCYNISTYFGRNVVKHAAYDDIIKLGKIAPGGTEIVKIARDDKVHVLLSDMHFSMGGELCIKTDADGVTVSGFNSFSSKGNYLVSLPNSVKSKDGRSEFSFTVNGLGAFSYTEPI